MSEITSEDLYDGLLEFGLFSEKLPPIFDVHAFAEYCKNMHGSFASKPYQYAVFNSIRNIDIPRTIGIPTPFAHARVCKLLRDNWPRLQKHFENKTKRNAYKVSRIHIRKITDSKSLFKMNYDNWLTDGTPEDDISIGKRYLVRADISKCFPSIYTHAIPWAIVGKGQAKKFRKNKSLWYNKLDSEVSNSTYGETHGVLIGPHTSNIISEIILCAVDEKLSKKWDYVRRIDDYSCYVDNKDDAEKFIVNLGECLREYGLSINNKKTQIIEMPELLSESWPFQMLDRQIWFRNNGNYINYNMMHSFLDFSIKLMVDNGNNASVVLYGVKMLSSYKISPNAKKYYEKKLVSLALMFPYIVPLLNEYVFKLCNTTHSDMERYLNAIFLEYLKKDNFEAVSYVLYYAVLYDLPLRSFDVKKIIKKNDCILSVCCLIYCRHFNLASSLYVLEKYAKQLLNSGMFEEQWVFAYECLSPNDLIGDWKALKSKGVSFLKNNFI